MRKLIYFTFLAFAIMLAVPKTVYAAKIGALGWDAYDMYGNDTKRYRNGRIYVIYGTGQVQYMAVVTKTTESTFVGPIYQAKCYVYVNNNKYELPTKDARFNRNGSITVECDKGQVSHIGQGLNEFKFEVDLLLGNPPRQHITVSRTENVYFDTKQPLLTLTITTYGNLTDEDVANAGVNVFVSADDETPGRLGRIIVKYRQKDKGDWRVKELTEGLPSGTFKDTISIPLVDFGIAKEGDYTLEFEVVAEDEIGNRRTSRAEQKVHVAAAPKEETMTETPTQTQEPSITVEDQTQTATPSPTAENTAKKALTDSKKILAIAGVSGLVSGGFAYLMYKKFLSIAPTEEAGASLKSEKSKGKEKG